MESSPPTPDPSDHQGPSAYEGWDPTPDPVGEVDIPDAAGSGTTTAPGVAFQPAPTPSASPSTPATTPATAGQDDELTALRERLAFYETFDSLIRDNIDRAGALMREVATRQADAEVKLRTTTRDFERRQIEERSGYRSVFGSLLDEVSTIQQQVERLARRVSDALDDLELQLPAAGELSAIERGQAPGMTGLAMATVPPAGLPSGASSAAWVAHDVDLPATTGKHATDPSYHPEPEPALAPATEAESESGPTPVSPDDELPAGLPADELPADRGALAADDVAVVEDAAGAVDPAVVGDVLTEGTDADPAVAEQAEELPTGSFQPTDLSDLPEEFGLDNPVAPGSAGVVDEPYVEQAEIGYSEPPAATDDGASGHASPVSTGAEGFYVDATPRIDELLAVAVAETPLMAAAPDRITEVDGGLDESPADGGDPGALGLVDASASGLPTAPEAPAPYGSDAPSASGIGSEPTAGGNGSSGQGEPPSKLRRFEAEAARPTWGSVPPAPRVEPPRAPAGQAAGQAAGQGDEATAQDTIVLVHGVPRATTALSLKRYLEGLEAVTAVEPREYAEGVLRLQVTGERAIRVTDLSAWPDGSGLQEIQVREDLVEIRLPG